MNTGSLSVSKIFFKKLYDIIYFKKNFENSATQILLYATPLCFTTPLYHTTLTVYFILFRKFILP